MPHGTYMRGTRLDYLIAAGLVFLLLLILAFAISPARSLAFARDERRSDDVRRVMAAVLQLAVDNPDKYQALLTRVSDPKERYFMLGNGTSCAGDWGRACTDAQVEDACVPLGEVFANDEQQIFDPERSRFGTFATGYYVTVKDESLIVGACNAALRPIFLQALVKKF